MDYGLERVCHFPYTMYMCIRHKFKVLTFIDILYMKQLIEYNKGM